MNTFNFVCLLSIVFLIKNYLNFNKIFNNFNKSFKEHIFYNITIDYNKKYNIYEMFNFHNLIENII